MDKMKEFEHREIKLKELEAEIKELRSEIKDLKESEQDAWDKFMALLDEAGEELKQVINKGGIVNEKHTDR